MLPAIHEIELVHFTRLKLKSRISTLICMLSGVSKWHGTKWKRAKIYNLAEGSFIFSCRESHSGTVATQGAFAFFTAPRRRNLGTGFPMLPFSRSNLPTCSSYIYLPYLRYMYARRPTSRRRRRFAQVNTIRSVFCFPFFSP